MTKQKTLWSNRESKWKPRNLQAARVTFPAKGLHLPPEEIKPPTFAPTQAQIAEAESAARRKRIAAADAEWALKKAEVEAADKARRAAARKKQEAAKPKAMWAAKYLRRMAKISGKPKPTTAELQLARKAAACGSAEFSTQIARVAQRPEQRTHNPTGVGSTPTTLIP